MRCVWQVERDEYRRAVLERHWPGVERWNDVYTFPRPWSKHPDVICGGPPCQRTSVAAAIQGKRTGETLWPEMFRVVRTFKPRFVVVEQPSGNAKWERQVASDLAGAGYSVSRLQRSAEDHRAPHRRRRVFIVADTLQERWQAVAWQPGPSETSAVAWPAPPRGAWREAGAGNRRMDDGFSDWLDRLEALGDAVVPQVAEWIGWRIVEAATITPPPEPRHA
jgi:DNA (cytosine-5)-methyltransferase 1